MNRTTPILIAAAAAAAALLPASAARADFDVSPSVSGGRILTNAYTDEGPSADNNYTPFVSNVRVFDFDLGGDDPSNPYFAQDPGFHPQPGLGFSATSQVRVGAVSTLSYYKGTGPISFAATPAKLALSLNYGSTTVSVTGTSAPTTTILLSGSNTPSSGEFDRHLGSTLVTTDGSAPADGLYLVQLQVTDPADGFTPSLPAYVLYNLNADDAVDATKLYLRNTFAPGTNLAPAVPEPTGLALAGAGGLALLRRRRRRRM